MARPRGVGRRPEDRGRPRQHADCVRYDPEALSADIKLDDCAHDRADVTCVCVGFGYNLSCGLCLLLAVLAEWEDPRSTCNLPVLVCVLLGLAPTILVVVTC